MNKNSVLDDLDFSLGEGAPSQRQTYRAAVRGIQLRVEEGGHVYEVLDVSAAGCSIHAPENSYAHGRLLNVQLEIKGRPIIRGLTARVVRTTDDGMVACALQGMTRQQEYAMDKLVLEIQKRVIALHKALQK